MRVFSPLPCTRGRGAGGEGAEPPYASSPSPPTPLPRITGGEGSQSVLLSSRPVNEEKTTRRHATNPLPHPDPQPARLRLRPDAVCRVSAVHRARPALVQA